MIDVSEVIDYIVSFLEANQPNQIGNNDVPSATPTLPYSCVYLLPSPTPTGPNQDPQTDIELVLQITSVGRSPQSAGKQSHFCRGALIGRDGDGVFTVPMAPVGYTVSDRILSTVGSIVKSGDRLFEVADTFRIKVVP